MSGPSPLAVFFAAVFTQNLLLHYFLGNCPFLACSGRPGTAAGLGLAVALVTTCTSVLNHLVYHHLLVPLELAYLGLIVFVAVIAAFAQLLEMILERFSPALQSRLGLFLPLTTVNCAILGATWLSVIQDRTLGQAAAFGFGGGAGWMLVIVLMAALRQKAAAADVPEPFRGVALAMVLAGVMAMAFAGLKGMIPL